MKVRFKIALIVVFALAIHGTCLCAAHPTCAMAAGSSRHGPCCPHHRPSVPSNAHHCCALAACSVAPSFTADRAARAANLPVRILAAAVSPRVPAGGFVSSPIRSVYRANPLNSRMPLFLSLRTLLI